MFNRRLTPDAQRRRMVESQLRRRGIRATNVLEAIGRVPRERFVTEDMQGEAYADRALPIDCGQTISQPFIVALMTEALEIGPSDTVLEIGTGSGYQTAILAELAGRVVTIERHEELSRQARRRLEERGYENVEYHVGDGSLGYAPGAPYDGIIVTAAADRCPPTLWEQLAEGGRLVGPFGTSDEQRLYCLEKRGGEPLQSDLGGCRFVPLIAEGNS